MWYVFRTDVSPGFFDGAGCCGRGVTTQISEVEKVAATAAAQTQLKNDSRQSD